MRLARVVESLRRDRRRFLGASAWFLAVTGICTIGMGVIASLAAAGPDTVPALRIPFGVAGAGLMLAGILTVLRRREELVTSLLAGITAASFAMSLVEMSVRAADAPDRYSSLWIPSVLAVALVAVRLFEGGFRIELERSDAGS